MKKLILIGLLIVSTISCEDFEGWNIDNKHPGEVSGDYLVTFAQLQMARRVWDMNVNVGLFSMWGLIWDRNYVYRRSELRCGNPKSRWWLLECQYTNYWLI
ncbi:MAG: hypothetical protein U5K51_12375 [Flavobacteriaceae bacterium]|nr:hypothetical protein [Flavobacteriaceae bacterium]